MKCIKVEELFQLGKFLAGLEKEVMNIEQIVIDKGGYYDMV